MTVKHTLVSSDMRVFALCSLKELHRSKKNVGAENRTGEAVSAFFLLDIPRFPRYSIYIEYLGIKEG